MTDGSEDVTSLKLEKSYRPIMSFQVNVSKKILFDIVTNSYLGYSYNGWVSTSLFYGC